MKAFRALHLSAILVVGLAIAGVAPVPALAGDRITAPGVYDASIVYIPGVSVPGGLPACVDEFARQIYVGKLTVTQGTGSGYTVTFVGENEEDATLNLRATARFNANWGGFLLGGLGGRDDALIGIDVANLESGRVIGRITGQNGKPGTLIVRVGAAGSIESCRFVGPAAH
jgi:hypothetical protein